MSVAEAEFESTSRASSRIIQLVALTVAAFVTWAAFASVDEIVRADGQVVSSSRAQIVQNLEGGILAELFVAQGDRVKAGQILARLQDTKFRAAVDDLQDQIDALDIRRLRIEAEMTGAHEFAVPTGLSERSPGILASERTLLAARQADFDARRNGAREILDQQQEELATMERLYQQEIVAKLEVNNAKKSVSDAQIKYTEIGTSTKLELAEDYSRTLQDLTSRQQELRLASDQLKRTVITAPLPGIVNSLAVTTIGGVVRPGEEILQIIPLGEELFVEAQVMPEDIASVETGQPATIKLSAYDYTIYGTLQGRVAFVSADTFKDERDPNALPFYKVNVRVDRDEFTERQDAIEIRPGMRATAELQTGAKTVLQYLLKPLYKSREALRER